jgi:VNT family MFS transporter (synaptic vesicle glycoprotein 2)
VRNSLHLSCSLEGSGKSPPLCRFPLLAALSMLCLCCVSVECLCRVLAREIVQTFKTNKFNNDNIYYYCTWAVFEHDTPKKVQQNSPLLRAMMRPDEGNGLLGGTTERTGNTIDNCIDNPKPGVALMLALSLAAGNAADAVEIMCVGFIMSEMDGISTYKKEFLSAAVFMGMLFGGVACGYISDALGRRPCLLYALALNTLAGLASAIAPNIDILIFLRVVAGLGIGGSVPIVFSLGAEMFPSVCRGQYLSIIATFWMVGAIYVALSAWIMLGDDFYGHKMMPGVTWRPFAVVSALPAIVAWWLTYTNIPESPRFLAAKRRFVEAAGVLSGLSTVSVTADDLQNGSEGAVVDFKSVHGVEHVGNNSNTDTGAGYAPLNNASHHRSDTPSRSRSGESLGAARKAVATALKQSTIGLLFQGQLRRTSLILLVIWFTLSFGSYGMSTWISTLFADVGIGNPYAAAFIFAMANLPGNVVSLVFIEKYGRRWLLSVGMCLAAASALGFAFDTHMPAVVVLCAALFNAFSVIGWNSLDCLSGKWLVS